MGKEHEISYWRMTATDTMDERPDGVGVRFFSENYAALPEMAGDQLLAILHDLPEAPGSLLRNAFLGEQILIRTHQELQELLREEGYMDQMLEEAAGPDIDLRDSLKIDPTQPSADLKSAIRRENDDAQRKAEQSIREEMGDIDDKVSESFQQNFDSDSTGKDWELDRLRNMAPVECYRMSMRILCHRIINAASADGRRDVLAREKCAAPDIESYPIAIMGLVGALRGPDDDDREQEQDD